MGGCVPDVCFRVADFLAIFLADFSFVFCDLKDPPQKSTEKSTTFMAAFCKTAESRLKGSLKNPPLSWRPFARLPKVGSRAQAQRGREPIPSSALVPAFEIGIGFGCEFYNPPSQLQRPRTPDLENSRKTAEKGAEWAPGKVPGKQPKNSRTGSQTAEKQLFCMLRMFFRLFFGCFPGTSPGAHSAPFSAVFRLFSRSGVRGLCSWLGRS